MVTLQRHCSGDLQAQIFTSAVFSHKCVWGRAAHNSEKVSFLILFNTKFIHMISFVQNRYTKMNSCQKTFTLFWFPKPIILSFKLAIPTTALNPRRKRQMFFFNKPNQTLEPEGSLRAQGFMQTTCTTSPWCPGMSTLNSSPIVHVHRDSQEENKSFTIHFEKSYRSTERAGIWEAHDFQ